ncbi:MAG: hypothetical protein WCL11_23035, partial [Verrucomicrobiota bacterium]
MNVLVDACAGSRLARAFLLPILSLPLGALSERPGRSVTSGLTALARIFHTPMEMPTLRRVR